MCDLGVKYENRGSESQNPLSRQNCRKRKDARPEEGRQEVSAH